MPTSNLLIQCTDAWFDMEGGQTRLRIATTEGVLLEFWTPMPFGLVRFTRLGCIKDRAVYEASESRPGDDLGPVSQDQLRLLSGPFLRGPQDVA